MSWNYRVIRRVVNDETMFAVHEAYYNAPGDERPHSITVEPVTPVGNTIEELREAICRFSESLSKPVLDHDGQWETRDA